MNISHSGTLIFLGATSDHLYKKIFPALYAMERREHLHVPVIASLRNEFGGHAVKSVK